LLVVAESLQATPSVDVQVLAVMKHRGVAVPKAGVNDVGPFNVAKVVQLSSVLVAHALPL
jgi:hypothetical protein